MVDKKLETLAYRLKDLSTLRNLFSELNFDFTDKPVNKDNWNDEQKKIVQDARIIASKDDYQIYYIQTNTDSLKEWKGISSKIIKDNNGLCMICSHNPSGFKWIFSSLSKDFSKSFSETRHVPIDINPDTGVPHTFVEFLEKIKVAKDSTSTSIVSQISEAFDSFAIQIHDELTVNVFEALKVLSEGIIADKNNNLSLSNETLEEIRESIFILLYRIIFILYAEDRGIFPVDNKIYHEEFSLKWIKQNWILKLRNVKTLEEYEVENRLKKLFKLIEVGSEELNYKKEEFFMRSYYGRIFDRKINHSLEEWNIPNSNLFEAISLLTRTKDKKGNYFFLDYSALETRHLGSIYEHLLEFHLHVKNKNIADLPNPKQRKESGSYYTPKNIVDDIVQKSIEPLIQNIINKNPDKQIQIEKILSLKILDPAMGSGHFLVGAVEYTAKRICEIEFGDIPEQSYIERKRDVVRRCIYGVDLNPLSVDLARLSLWLETISSNKPLSFLSAHLKQGNSLVGTNLQAIFDKQTTMFESEKGRNVFRKNLKKFLMFETLEDDSATAVKMKLEEYAKIRSKGTVYYDLKFLLDCKTGEHFGINVPNLGDYRAKVGENSLDFYTDKNYQNVKKISDELSFFHWELEFPQIFFDEEGVRKNADYGFDIVLGNPPYVEVKKIPDSLKPYLKKSFTYDKTELIKGRFDLFWAFMKKGIDLLQNNGYFGFLTEDSLLDAIGADSLRMFLIKENTMMGFHYMGKFPNAGVFTVASILKKEFNKDYTFTFEDLTNNKKILLKKSHILEQHKQIINLKWISQRYENNADDKIVNKIEKESIELEKIIFLQQGIIVQWGTGKTMEKAKHDCIFSKQKQDLVPYIEGKNVSRYKFPKEHDWLEYRPDKHHRPRMTEVFHNPKLLVRRIATESLVCLLDDGYFFVDNTLFTGNRWHELLPIRQKYSRQLSKVEGRLSMTLEELSEISKLFQYDYLLGILNSRLMTYYYDKKFKTKSLEVLTKCKIKKCEKPIQKTIGTIAKTIQKLNTNEIDTDFFDKQILDSLIYELYLNDLLKTNLTTLIEPLVSNIAEYLQKNDYTEINHIIDEIKNNPEIMNEIKTIKQTKIVSDIEQ